MPTTLVSDVITECRSLLNDIGGQIFSDARLLPFINKAYAELQKHYLDNGVQVLNEIAANLDIAAGTVTIDPQVSIASNFYEPVKIQERADGSTSEDDWVDMTERDWEPSEAQQTILGVWVWREQQIKFRGATEIREIRVFYLKALTRFALVTDPVGIEGAQEFLAARSSALAAALIGENMTRAEALQDDANGALSLLLSINGKKRQNLPIRRRSFQRPRRIVF